MKMIKQLMDSARDLLEWPPEIGLELPERFLALPACRAPAVDLLLIDVSISMGLPDYTPSRLAGAVTASKHFLAKLASQEPEAAVGIATFYGFAKLVHPPLPVRAGLPALEQALDSLQTLSATNLGAGLRIAEQTLARVQTKGRRRTVLLTDGESNTGPRPEPIAARMKQAGIQLDIIGIGGSPADVDEPLLKRMASVVGGEQRYWFIRSVGELIERFETLALREVH